jgi:hypothetical protein
MDREATRRAPARARRIALCCAGAGVLLLAAPSPTQAETPPAFQPQYRPTLHVVRAGGPIHIDGDLGDAGWESAARALGFAEVEPGDQIEPPVQSEAWMTYDDVNLYLALIAHDRPEEVRASLRERDQIWTDDYFGLILDTYGDLAWAYELFVNPLGIQGDLRMLGDDEDISMDLVWHSRGKVTESGYQVEIAIPFSSLRFPDRPEQVWRANFWRDHQRESRRRYAWAAIDRDDPCYLCNWGTITGIQGIHPGRNLDAIASVTGLQNHRRKPPGDPSGRLDSEELDGEASLNLRYGLSSDASAEVTLNPDFSQIESDAGEIDINNPFAIFYPERRPFFQEGSDLYATWISAIYTRSINDPDAAGKLTGRKGRTAFAYSIARDGASPIILPQEERSYFLQGGKSFTNFLRVRHTHGENSHVGGLVTDRRIDGGGSATTFGIDGTVRFLRNLRIELQALASYTEEPRDTSRTEGLNDIPIATTGHTLGFDGERFWGDAIYASLERDGRRWGLDFDYWEYSPTFRADNGFITRSEYRETDFWTGLGFQPNRPWLRSSNVGVALGRIWSFDGRFQDQWLVPSLSFTTKRQTSAELEVVWSRERFRERMFDGIRRFSASTETRWSELLGTGLEIRTGRTIWRTFSETPVLGRLLDIEISASLHPTQRLLLEPSLQFSRMRTPDDRADIFEGHILRSRLTYLFTRNLSTRLVVEYDNFDGRMRVEPLFTYRHNAFTVFYLGLSGNGTEYEMGDAGRDTSWKVDTAQVFAKFQYLYQL